MTSNDKSIFSRFHLSNDASMLRGLTENTKNYTIELCKTILNYMASIADYKKALSALKVLEPFNTLCIPSSSLLSLTEMQKNIIEYFQYVNSLFICMPTGSGKTIMALVISLCHLQKYPDDRIIVISPKSVLNNFNKEAKKFGITYDKSKYIYYTFDGFYLELKEDKTKDMSNTLFIIDEVHELRNYSGKKYMSIMKGANDCRKVLLLSATPVVNTLADYISIINLLYKSYVIFPSIMTSYEGYREEVDENGETTIVKTRITPDIFLYKAPYMMLVTRARNARTRMYTDMKNIPLLSKLLSGHVVYRAKDANDVNLPRVNIHNQYTRMSMSYYNNYKLALRLMADVKQSDFTDLFSDPSKFYNGYRRAVNQIGGEEYYSSKIKTSLELIKTRRSIIYTNWLEYGENMLEMIIRSNGITTGSITGRVSDSERDSIVKQYNSGKINTLIITEAGAEGIDLKGVEVVIVVDPPWSPSILDQIIGRAVRYKSHDHLPPEKRVVDVYLMQLIEPNINIEDMINEKVSTDSGDVILYNIINRKKILIEKSNEMLQRISVV